MAELIKAKALSLGFSAVGIARAERLELEKERLSAAIRESRTTGMDYLKNTLDTRTDPSLFLDHAASVIMVLINYYPEKKQNPDCSFKVAKYTYGRDYHLVIKEKLQILLEFIQNLVGSANGKIFADSSPVLEKAWAVKCGLGWIGKNSLLINEKYGSFCFIGGIITDLELEYDHPVEEKCGYCHKCVDNCPTSALIAPYRLDATSCITFHNIENRKNLVPDLPDYHGWIYGCENCQDICPWNHNLRPATETAFHINPFIETATDEDWMALENDSFKEIFNESTLLRSGFERIMKLINDSLK